MADIVNVRDLTIQAQLPRLLPVTMPGNITVPTTNVPGLPDYYASSKQVELRATSQIFQISKVGGISPSSIILTANRKNILGVITWTVLSGSVTYTTGNDTLTIQAGGLTSDTATIRASVTSDSITYTDVMTIVKVEEGVDAVTGFLTNESTAVPALANGNVLSYDNSGGQFRVLNGIVDVTGTAVTYSVVSSTGVSISIANTGVYTVNNLTVDAGSAILQASYGGVNIQKVYTITKSKQGVDGTDGTQGIDGTRGNVNIAVPTTGSIWSDAQATEGIASAGFGVPMNRDIVTLYNLSSNFSQSKYFDGSAWQTLDAYINGNLLVTGSVVADKIDSRGLSIKDNAGNVILSAGVPIDKNYLNFGAGTGNLINNSGPYPGTMGPFNVIYTVLNGKPYTALPSYDPYRPTGSGGVYAYVAGGMVTGETVVFGNLNSGTEIKIPVVAGQRYELSAYMSAHRCSGFMEVDFIDASGNQIGSATGSVVTASPDNGLSNWEPYRSVGFGVAPTGSVYAYIRPKMQPVAGGGANAYLFISMQYFAMALPAQTVATAWADGAGATFGGNLYGQITSGNASTYIADAAIRFAAIDKATINNLSVVSQLVGLLRTRDTGARMEIADDVIRIYNDSDQIKIKIGKLD